MKEKVLSAVVAGGLLVGAGFVTAAISSPAVAGAQEDSSSADPSEENHVRPFSRHAAILDDVLADLVDDGTIDQGQADAIVEALTAKAEELKAERQELRVLIEDLLEDGVLSADELAQLPEDHPFNDPDGPYADALEDGELTIEEIREERPHPRRDWFKRGVRFGAILDDGGIDQSEYDGLSDDHPLKQIDVSEYLEDGVISIDELREIRQSQSDSGDAA